MRGAFVIRLHAESDPATGRLVGRVEEVDSGKEMTFQSIEELLSFLSERFRVTYGQKALKNVDFC